MLVAVAVAVPVPVAVAVAVPVVGRLIQTMHAMLRENWWHWQNLN